MSKKVIIFSNYDDIKNPYYAGGGAIAIHETAKRLSKSYAVTVITGKYPGSTNEIVEGISYERIGITQGGPKLGQLAYQFILPFIAIQKKSDIWFENFTPPFSISLLPFLPNKRVVGLVHMLSGLDMRRKYFLPFDVIESLGLRFYKEIVVTTEAIEKTVSQAAPQTKIFIITNGITPMDLAKRAKKHLLFIGRIEVNQKGLDLVLEAIATIKTKLRYPLMIAGSGEQKQLTLLSTLIAQYGLQKQVQIVGKITGKQKQRVFEEAAMIIVPSRFETFSLTCLEALASGVPLITFGIVGLSWIPKQVRVVIKPFLPEKLGEAILSLSTHEKERSRLIKEGRKFAQKFSWDSVAGEYQTLIEKK